MRLPAASANNIAEHLCNLDMHFAMDTMQIVLWLHSELLMQHILFIALCFLQFGCSCLLAGFLTPNAKGFLVFMGCLHPLFPARHGLQCLCSQG